MTITPEGAGRWVVAEVLAAGWTPPAWAPLDPPPPDVDVHAVIAYQAGIPPVDYAEGQVTVLVGITWRIADAATMGLVCGFDLTDGALARRVLGNLLDSGVGDAGVAGARTGGR